MPSVLAGLTHRPLTWTQPHALTPAHELRHGDNVVGTLEFRSRFGTLAYAKVGDDCWTMKRVGFLRTRVEIRRCDSDATFATFHHNTWSGGGTLALPDGREFRANTNFWHSRYEFVNDRDAPILRYASGGFIKTPATSEVMHVPVRVAAATTTFTIGITSATGLAVFAVLGRLDLHDCAAVAAGSLVGGQLGARIQSRLSPAQVRRFLSALLLLVGAVLLVK